MQAQPRIRPPRRKVMATILVNGAGPVRRVDFDGDGQRLVDGERVVDGEPKAGPVEGQPAEDRRVSDVAR